MTDHTAEARRLIAATTKLESELRKALDEAVAKWLRIKVPVTVEQWEARLMEEVGWVEIYDRSRYVLEQGSIP